MTKKLLSPRVLGEEAGVYVNLLKKIYDEKFGIKI